MASYRCEVPLTHKKIPSPMPCDLGIFRFISIHTINELIIIGTAQEIKAPSTINGVPICIILFSRFNKSPSLYP